MLTLLLPSGALGGLSAVPRAPAAYRNSVGAVVKDTAFANKPLFYLLCVHSWESFCNLSVSQFFH